MAKNNNRNQSGRHNNNPHGHNQYTNQWVETARDHPIATAAAAAGAAGAVAAGVYLWSHRNDVGNQVSKISRTASEMGRKASQKASEKASEWTERMRSDGSSGGFMMADGSNDVSATGASRRTGSKSKSSGGTRGKSRRTPAQPVS
jgi:hypothetical protein